MIKPQHALTYQRGQLFIEGQSVEKLVQLYGTPLYVYSSACIRDSYQMMTRAFSRQPRATHLQVCYAVKANSNLEVLREMSRLGAGCDLVSYGEWVRAEKAGIPRPLRVLSGVAKTQEELTALLKHPGGGVGSIHVESVMELDALAKLASKFKNSINIAFRYNPDVDARTLDKISTGRKQDKFGLNVNEVLEMTRKYAHHRYVKIHGLSIHIGSQITKIAPYKKAFQSLDLLCKKVESILGRSLIYVDLGGGIGIQYHEEKPIPVTTYAALAQSMFNRYSKILIEPGRSLVANSGILVTRSIYTKVRDSNRTLILDAGMNDLMRPALYDARHELIPVQKSKSKPQKWDIVGGICETTDYFERDKRLVVTKNSDELFAFLSVGAYGFSMSSSYNTRPRLAEVWVEGSKHKLIRKRESIQDLIKHEI